MNGRGGSKGGGTDSDRDTDESFADAFGDDVSPLRGRDDRVADAPAARPGYDRREAAVFIHPDPDEPGLGFADGISDAQRRRLERGRIPCERRVDLHGMRAEEARRHCLDELSEAIDAGERCVLVVHGRGKNSKQAPVLRQALPGWLAEPRLAGRVLAFAPAQPADGGNGATYVLLRRTRG